MKLFRNILWAFLLGIPLFAILRGINIMLGAAFEVDRSLLIDFGLNQLYVVPLFLVNGYYFAFLKRVFPVNQYTSKRLLTGVFGSIIITMLTIFVMRMVVEMGIYGADWATFINGETPGFYIIAFVITIMFTMFFHAFYFYKALQEKKVKEQKVIAGTATAQFDALKNQLDPHFLFNSLNVLTSLIDENPDTAQKFTTALSKVYRYVLEQKNKDVVSVTEELDFAGTYVALLKMRFEDSIVFDIPEQLSNPEAKLVPLSLQLLLENTVKHNIVNLQKPLRIKIYEQDGYLLVENNLQPKEILKKSSGVGLMNIRQRYQILSKRKVIIEKDQETFTVKLPMLTEIINVMEYNSSSDRYIRARKKVEELKEFYTSLASYFLIIPFLIFINHKVYWKFQWFWFPALGWGIGLAIQAYKIYGPGFSWEERKIRQYMEKEKNKAKWQ